MEIQKVKTRSMDANRTEIVFDILVEKYGMDKVCFDEIDWLEALFSNGFMLAIKEGLTPELGSHKLSGESKYCGEYHHLISNEICYVIYFN